MSKEPTQPTEAESRQQRIETYLLNLVLYHVAKEELDRAYYLGTVKDIDSLIARECEAAVREELQRIEKAAETYYHKKGDVLEAQALADVFYVRLAELTKEQK